MFVSTVVLSKTVISFDNEDKITVIVKTVSSFSLFFSSARQYTQRNTNREPGAYVVKSTRYKEKVFS